MTISEAFMAFYFISSALVFAVCIVMASVSAPFKRKSPPSFTIIYPHFHYFYVYCRRTERLSVVRWLRRVGMFLDRLGELRAVKLRAGECLFASMTHLGILLTLFKMYERPGMI